MCTCAMGMQNHRPCIESQLSEAEMVGESPCMVSWDGSHQLIGRPPFADGKAPTGQWEGPQGDRKQARRGSTGVYNSFWSAGLLLTQGKPGAWCGSASREQLVWHATAIPSRTYPFSSDQGSQTGLGSISTRLSDRPGTLSAVVSFVFKLACCVCIVCSVSCFMLACCICTVCSVSCLHACLLHLHIVQSTEN